MHKSVKKFIRNLVIYCNSTTSPEKRLKFMEIKNTSVMSVNRMAGQRNKLQTIRMVLEWHQITWQVLKITSRITSGCNFGKINNSVLRKIFLYSGGIKETFYDKCRLKKNICRWNSKFWLSDTKKLQRFCCLRWTWSLESLRNIVEDRRFWGRVSQVQEPM